MQQGWRGCGSTFWKVCSPERRQSAISASNSASKIQHVDLRVPTTSKNTAVGVDAVELESIPAAGSLDVVDVLEHRLVAAELHGMLELRDQDG